jgi:hypothetical protein
MAKKHSKAISQLQTECKFLKEKKKDHSIIIIKIIMPNYSLLALNCDQNDGTVEENANTGP